MRCPRCGHVDDKVVDSRQSKDGVSIRRRRECLECAFRFTTYEQLELRLPMLVKADGRREAFDREKVLRGIRTACQKRPVRTEDLDGIADRIAVALASRPEREVPAAEVGNLVMQELRALDDVAYLRFASVYQSFETIAEFVAEADRVGRKRA